MTRTTGWAGRRAGGNGPAAQTLYERSLALLEELVAAEPQNTTYRHDAAVVH